MSFNKRPSNHIHANPSAKSCLSTISPGLVVIGNVSSAAEIHVEGKILGDVHCARLLIGLGARIEGNVFAQHVEVRGELAGSASARTVFVASTGRVDGNLLVENLRIEPGGHFDGNCGRTDAHVQSFAAVPAEKTSLAGEAVLTEVAEDGLRASDVVVRAHAATKQTSRLAQRRSPPLRTSPMN